MSAQKQLPPLGEILRGAVQVAETAGRLAGVLSRPELSGDPLETRADLADLAEQLDAHAHNMRRALEAIGADDARDDAERRELAEGVALLERRAEGIDQHWADTTARVQRIERRLEAIDLAANAALSRIAPALEKVAEAAEWGMNRE